MNVQTKYAWKCKVCNVTLSSKQVATVHVRIKHPDIDQTVPQVQKVNITVTNKSDNVIVIKKEKTEKNISKPTKKTFPYSNQLSTTFNIKNFFESFSLTKPCKSKPSKPFVNETDKQSVKFSSGKSNNCNLCNK